MPEDVYVHQHTCARLASFEYRGLREAVFETRIVEKRKEKVEGVWYQVRCGRFATREEAAQLRSNRLSEKAVIVEPMRQQ